MVKYNSQTPLFNEAKKKTRDDMAEVYKTIQKDNHALARLLYKKMKWCETELINKIINGEIL